MKKGVLIALISAFVLIALILVANSNLTGKVIQSTDERMPRHIFYHSPRVQADEKYAETCFPAHEVISILPGNKCCGELKQLALYDESEPDCSAPLTGGALCSDCGNSLCEYGENECNCPQDCNKPEVRI